MKKKIGFTGPVSETNLGDYAMLLNNIYDLDIKDITLFTYNYDFLKILKTEYLSNYNVELVDVILEPDLDKDIYDATSKARVGFLPFNPPTTTPMDILGRIRNIDKLRKHIRELDLLIVSGGGCFNHLWNNSIWRSDMLKKIIAPLLIATQEMKPIFFMGNSFGPFDNSEEYFMYVLGYLKNSYYAVRDRMYSKTYLLRLGIRQDRIQFIPDDLLFLNSSITELPYSRELSIIQGKKYIVLELYYPLEEFEKYSNRIKQFSETMKIKYDLSVVFLPFDVERGGMWQGEYLKSYLNHYYLYDFREAGYLPIQDAYQVIKNAEFVVCNRYHALVLSIGLAKPVINILKKVCDDFRYYFNKNYGLLEYVFDGLIFNEMDFLHSNLDTALEHIEQYYYNIISTQNKLYNSECYRKNLEYLKDIRSTYIQRIYKHIFKEIEDGYSDTQDI